MQTSYADIKNKNLVKILKTLDRTGEQEKKEAEVLAGSPGKLSDKQKRKLLRAESKLRPGYVDLIHRIYARAQQKHYDRIDEAEVIFTGFRTFFISQKDLKAINEVADFIAGSNYKMKTVREE